MLVHAVGGLRGGELTVEAGKVVEDVAVTVTGSKVTVDAGKVTEEVAVAVTVDAGRVTEIVWAGSMVVYVTGRVLRGRISSCSLSKVLQKNLRGVVDIESARDKLVQSARNSSEICNCDIASHSAGLFALSADAQVSSDILHTSKTVSDSITVTSQISVDVLVDVTVSMSTMVDVKLRS